MTTIHVMPVDDLREHDQASTCHCGPQIEEQPSGDFIVIHRSYDGREAVEQAEALLREPPIPPPQ